MATFVAISYFSNSLVATSETDYYIFDLDETEKTECIQFDELIISKSTSFSESGFDDLVDFLFESDALIVCDLADLCQHVPMANGIPHDLLVDQFVKFIRKVSLNHRIHLKLAQGEEKTILFIVLTDIINNSQQVSLEDILVKHRLIDRMNLVEFSSEEERLDYMQQKLDFISEFYAYCQEIPDFSIAWSEWISAQSPFTMIPANKCLYSQQKYLSLFDGLVCGKERGGSEVKVEISGGWGKSEVEYEVTFDAKGWDRDGRFIEFEIKHNSNGTGNGSLGLGQNNGDRGDRDYNGHEGRDY